MRRKDFYERRIEILRWIQEKQSKAYICRMMICKPETLDAFLKSIGILYKGNMGGKGKKVGNKKSVNHYLTNGGAYINSHALKIKLIKEGIKEEKCEKCKRKKWLRKKIPLELHHKDGIRFNNELINLEILCPNCHAIEGNNSGKGTISNKESVKKSKGKNSNNNRKRKVEIRPTKEKLQELIKELGYVGTGKIYGVSDNCIRKWMKIYNKQ